MDSHIRDASYHGASREDTKLLFRQDADRAAAAGWSPILPLPGIATRSVCATSTRKPPNRRFRQGPPKARQLVTPSPIQPKAALGVAVESSLPPLLSSSVVLSLAFLGRAASSLGVGRRRDPLSPRRHLRFRASCSTRVMSGYSCGRTTPAGNSWTSWIERMRCATSCRRSARTGSTQGTCSVTRFIAPPKSAVWTSNQNPRACRGECVSAAKQTTTRPRPDHPPRSAPRAGSTQGWTPPPRSSAPARAEPHRHRRCPENRPRTRRVLTTSPVIADCGPGRIRSAFWFVPDPRAVAGAKGGGGAHLGLGRVWTRHTTALYIPASRSRLAALAAACG